MLRFFAVRTKTDITVILEPRFEMRIEANARLGGEEQARRTFAVLADLLREQDVDGMQCVKPAEKRRLFLHQRADRDRARVAAAGRVLVLGEQTKIGPVFALRRQLDKAFERGSIIVEALPR